jgi:pimeloyl-ACP methyl ester carboxylesterase
MKKLTLAVFLGLAMLDGGVAYDSLTGPALAAGISQAELKLVTDSYMIPSRDPGIQLHVRNKRPEGMIQFSPEKTLLYVHGTSQAASSTFDLPLDGLSWMDYIAQHGYDVYLVDLRGYGGSTRPPEMEKPAAENPPIVRTDVAVEDVAATVDHILARRGVTKLNLMGWSWGTTIMGRYATQNSDKVNRLVLYAPAWTSEAPAGTQAPLGAYQTWTMEQARSRLQNGPAEEKKKDLMPVAWFEAWSAAALATDPAGTKQTPPVVRTPNGSVQDTRDYWQAGKPLWEPSEVKAPTLIAVGEWDAGTTAPVSAQAVFGKLNNALYKRLVQIGHGTHLLFLEKNRIQLFHEVQLFLDEPHDFLTASR